MNIPEMKRDPMRQQNKEQKWKLISRYNEQKASMAGVRCC